MLCVVFVASTPSVDAITNGQTWQNTTSGYETGESNIHVLKNGTLAYSGSSEIRFSVLFMTMDNFDRFTKNESFAYIQELSAVNVTQASVQAPIGPGDYAYVMYFYEPGDVTTSFIQITYPSSAGLAIPWDIMVAVITTAIVASAVTYVIMKRRIS